MPNNPAPNVTTMSPSSVIVGGSSFTLTINGSGFISGSVVSFNDSQQERECLALISLNSHHSRTLLDCVRLGNPQEKEALARRKSITDQEGAENCEATLRLNVAGIGSGHSAGPQQGSQQGTQTRTLRFDVPVTS